MNEAEVADTLEDATHAELEHTSRALARANEGLRMMTHGAVHDLRAPVRHIATWTAALEREHAAELGPEGLAKLRYVTGAAERLSKLIANLGDVSTALRGESATDRVRLPNVVCEAIAQLQEEIRAVGAEITVDVHGSVMFGRGALLRVFLNLIGNALKFGRLGVSPKIRIVGTKVGDRRIVRVEDNGIGILPADIPHVFEPFRRFAHSRAGTGLGLAIVQQFADNYGTPIAVESTPGVGSAFILNFKDGTP